MKIPCHHLQLFLLLNLKNLPISSFHHTPQFFQASAFIFPPSLFFDIIENLGPVTPLVYSSQPPFDPLWIDHHFLPSLASLLTHFVPFFHCTHQEQMNEQSESPVALSVCLWNFKSGPLCAPRDSCIFLAWRHYRFMTSIPGWLSALILPHSLQRLCSSPLCSNSLLRHRFTHSASNSACYCASYQSK